MVCYARPAFRTAAVVVVALLVCSRPLSHFLGTAEFMVAATAVTGAAAAGSAAVFAAFLSTRRRRAAAGGCVGCRFRCQHAMTEASSGRPSRLALVIRTDRRIAPPGGQGQGVGQDPVLMPTPVVRPRPAGDAGPRWPDRPATPGRPARAQAGSAV